MDLSGQSEKARESAMDPSLENMLSTSTVGTKFDPYLKDLKIAEIPIHQARKVSGTSALVDFRLG